MQEEAELKCKSAHIRRKVQLTLRIADGGLARQETIICAAHNALHEKQLSVLLSTKLPIDAFIV